MSTGSLSFVNYYQVWLPSRDLVVCLYFKIPVHFTRLNLQDGFWFVYLPFRSMVKFQFLAQYSVDHLPNQSCLVLFCFCACLLYSFIILLIISFLKFIFLSHVQVISCGISPVYHLKYLYPHHPSLVSNESNIHFGCKMPH